MVRTYAREILRIGVPAGIQGMVFSLSNLVIQAAINSLGAEVMAASAAAFIIEINIYVFLIAFGQAITTFVSQNYGAGNLARCFQITRVGMALDIAFTVAMGTLVITFARPLLGLFNADETVVELGIIRFWFIVAPAFLQVFIDVLSGALRGYGFSLPPALLALVGICGVRIAWLYTLFPASPTYGTLMACYPVSWLLTGIFIGILYRYCRGHIKLIRV
jgi:Na+-driven multidrug efflux pump